MSKVNRVGFELKVVNVSAKYAAQSKRVSIGRMLYFQWTLGLARTLGMFLLGILGDVVSFLLASMARIAKMRLAPTEPGSHTAAILTLVLTVKFARKKEKK